MDFSKSIWENRRTLGRPFVVAHRGVCGANIPCNTLAAFQIALDMGADVIELDVAKSWDGEFFVFHPSKEPVFLKTEQSLSNMSAEEIKTLRLCNADGIPTHYTIPTLAEAFALLKDRAYINVDKFWTDIPGIAQEIRKAGVEKQVIVKTFPDEVSLAAIERYAPDLMYMTLSWHKDTITEQLSGRNIHYIGMEALFDQETDIVATSDYVRAMHDQKLLVWYNAIVYDEREVISAGHTDDISMREDPALGWGWMLSRDVDFIQTDWVLQMKNYLDRQ